jgi:hypothetical protein
MLDANDKWIMQFKECILCLLAELTGTGRTSTKISADTHLKSLNAGMEGEKYLTKNPGLCVAISSEGHSYRRPGRKILQAYK